jgi:hypothetical protein
VFHKSKEIIYSEKTHCSSFFLIYQGNCKLQKNFKINDKTEESLADMKLMPILNLERGELVGLESVEYIFVQKELNKNYDFTLIVRSFIISQNSLQAIIQYCLKLI